MGLNYLCPLASSCLISWRLLHGRSRCIKHVRRWRWRGVDRVDPLRCCQRGLSAKQTASVSTVARHHPMPGRGRGQKNRHDFSLTGVAIRDSSHWLCFRTALVAPYYVHPEHTHTHTYTDRFTQTKKNKIVHSFSKLVASERLGEAGLAQRYNKDAVQSKKKRMPSLDHCPVQTMTLLSTFFKSP